MSERAACPCDRTRNKYTSVVFTVKTQILVRPELGLLEKYETISKGVLVAQAKFLWGAVKQNTTYFY
jgi:hypothetical protein